VLPNAPAKSNADDSVARGTPDALPELVCVIEADGTLVAVNRRWLGLAEFFGIAPQDAGVDCKDFAPCRRMMLPVESYVMPRRVMAAPRSHRRRVRR
jgi:hypothetical protein